MLSSSEDLLTTSYPLPVNQGEGGVRVDNSIFHFPSSLALKFLSSIILLSILTACVDTVPHRLRQGKELVNAKYYGFRADRWQELESSYLGAQAICCGPDKLNDDVRALELYCKAAVDGHKASQIEIGRLYSHETTAIVGKGTTIPYDRALAYAYFDLASQDGYTYADAMKVGLGSKLTPVEKARAEQLVKDFPDIPCAITR